MRKNENVKDHIVEVTTEMIKQYDGDTKNITARLIAEQADIGLGLINYHFKSKENLITECVQRIIGKVVVDFQIEQEFKSDKERLAACATKVFNFLFENAAISRISILGDFQNYTVNCNTVLTQKGFLHSLKSNISDADKSIIVFTLTAAMQAAFLGSEAAKQILGYDFKKTEDRATIIKKIVDTLFERMIQIDE